MPTLFLLLCCEISVLLDSENKAPFAEVLFLPLTGLRNKNKNLILLCFKIKQEDLRRYVSFYVTCALHILIPQNF